MDKNMGGGPIVDIACHYVDQWRVIFDSDPVRVKAGGIVISEGNPGLPGCHPEVDTFSSIVEYASGDLGSLVMSWGLPMGATSDGLEDCLGPAGVLKVRGNNLTLVTQGGKEETFEKLASDMHPQQLNAFARAIREDMPVVAGGEDGLWALKVSHAMLQSINEGRAVEIAAS